MTESHDQGPVSASGNNTPSSEDDRIDVAQIMTEIREIIAEKKKKGLYSDEEIEEIARLKLETYADSAEIDMQLVRYLREENRLWNITSDYAISSHRGRFAGLIVLVKRLVRPFVRLYTDHIVERQAQLNLYTVHILHNLIREFTRLRIEHTQLTHRVQVLEQELRFFQKRERTLEDIVSYRDEADATGPNRSDQA
ncbi:hypothetical protein JXQ70_19150 [bacterium]|nr:hypothetical protein [bacterium]